MLSLYERKLKSKPRPNPKLKLSIPPQKFDLERPGGKADWDSFDDDELEDDGTGRGCECIAEPSSRNELDNWNASSPEGKLSPSLETVGHSSCPSGNEPTASEPALLSPVPLYAPT